MYNLTFVCRDENDSSQEYYIDINLGKLFCCSLFPNGRQTWKNLRHPIFMKPQPFQCGRGSDQNKNLKKARDKTLHDQHVNEIINKVNVLFSCWDEWTNAVGWEPEIKYIIMQTCIDIETRSKPPENPHANLHWKLESICRIEYLSIDTNDQINEQECGYITLGGRGRRLFRSPNRVYFIKWNGEILIINKAIRYLIETYHQKMAESAPFGLYRNKPREQKKLQSAFNFTG